MANRASPEESSPNIDKLLKNTSNVQVLWEDAFEVRAHAAFADNRLSRAMWQFAWEEQGMLYQSKRAQDPNKRLESLPTRQSEQEKHRKPFQRMLFQRSIPLNELPEKLQLWKLPRLERIKLWGTQQQPVAPAIWHSEEKINLRVAYLFLNFKAHFNLNLSFITLTKWLLCQL